MDDIQDNILEARDIATKMGFLHEKDEQPEEEVERVRVDLGIPPQLAQTAQPRPCLPVDGAGGDQVGDREEMVVEEERVPFWEDSNNLDFWWPVAGDPEAEQEMEGPIARLDISFGGCRADVLGDGIRWVYKKSSDESDGTPDGSAWERAGIGTGWSCTSAFWGCEVAGRRLTRQRRARVRDK